MEQRTPVVGHPEFESEQVFLLHAYACVEAMRVATRQLTATVVNEAGGTHQARFERDVLEERALERLSRLELGTESLVFGRIDRLDAERFHIGRIPVNDAQQNSVVVDWRAPVAEAFYRATGRNPLGLERRRHFATKGPQLLGIDDEVFSIDALESGDDSGLVGTGALLAALGQARTGHMRDIVATIQAEQDEIIRAELPGVLVVQGGPGTGKTAVALHRASYLLYTHRFPLERQGVLVVGPNRLFMRYISRVLPSLGETGVALAAIDELVPEVTVTALEPQPSARVKGDVRMSQVMRRAVATRQRPLREDLVLGVGIVQVRIRADETAELIATVRRSHRLHNAARKHLAQLLADRLHHRYREALQRTGRLAPDGGGGMGQADFAALVRRHDTFRSALDRMWPLLTPEVLLRDLLGAPALVRAAARDVLSDAEQGQLIRDRGESLMTVPWTSSDIPLLDEAGQLLGPLPPSAHLTDPVADASAHADEGLRTYGHIVVDEAQDLSPMQLRMLARRSLSGSMTVVGDIGQATGMWAPETWDDVLAHLPKRKAPSREVELTVGYRTPSEIMALAARVLEIAAPKLSVPRSVRSTGVGPSIVTGEPTDDVAALAARALATLSRSIGEGTIGVLAPDALVDDVRAAIERSGVGTDEGDGFGGTAGVSVIPVRNAKGLEFDGVLVVEPARVVADSAQGLRSLYVALTRATRLLTIVHVEPLPDCLLSGD